MNTKTTALEARVKAVNKANGYAKMIYPKLSAMFKKFLGTKIEKADGSLTVKVKKELPELPEVPGVSTFRDRSQYSLLWTVSACENSEHSTLYHKTSVYIGEMKDGVLTKLTEYFCENLRTDYTVEDILAKREAYKAAKKIADAAESALFPFGDYDR